MADRDGPVRALCNAEVIILRVFPVDQPDSDIVLTNPGTDLHAIAKKIVDLCVSVVEPVGRVPCNPLKLMDGSFDKVIRDILFHEPVTKQVRLDVRFSNLVLPMTQIVVSKCLTEETNDTSLRSLFSLADGSHTRRILPVSSSCIIPCLIWRALNNLDRILLISSCISEKTPIRSFCSEMEGALTRNSMYSSALIPG